MAHHTTPRTVDAVVIGAGFGGIYSVHKLANELGLTVVGFDKADGPGGTWYWNRYPGALSDTESHLYRYSFDRDLLQDGSWKSTYITQPEILEYLESVVERFDLGRHFRFGTAVESAIYLDDEGQWEVTTDDGAVYRATYVINAVGLLSAINFPNLPGLETFEGDTIHTAAWPEGKDLTGRRVGVIGTGSTGQQVITALAPEVEHLTVFVRTPQYSVPVGNRPVTTTQIDAVKADYDQIWAQVKRSAVAFGFEESTVPAMSVSEEERRRGLRGGLAAWRRIPLHVRHLRRHRHRRGSQRSRRILHPVQDRRDHRGPGDGSQADADGHVRQAPAVRRRLPRGLQPPERGSRCHQGESDPRSHRQRVW